MAEHSDFFNVYTIESLIKFYGPSAIMGVIEMSFQFYFLTKILKRRTGFLSYFLFAVCALGVNLFFSGGTIIRFIAPVLLLTASGIFVCHGDFKSSFLYAALTTEIMLLCYNIARYLMSLLCPRMPAVFHDVEGMAFLLAAGTVSLALTGFCYYMVYRYFSRDVLYPKNTIYSKDALYPKDALYSKNAFYSLRTLHPFYAKAEMQQMFLVFIPILMIFIMSEYVNVLEFRFQCEILVDGKPSGYLFSYWQLLVMNFLGLLSLFCILFSYKKLQQNFHLSTELSLLEQQEHSLDQYVEEAKARYDRTKSFRHDIRNHIAVVKKLLQSGKLEEAASYMEDLDDMAEKMSFPCSTNNPVVDILVGNKLGIAKSMGIDVDCSLLLPYPCGLRDIDICIVLSNALDNAIQACKNMETGTEKYIQLSGRIQGDFLMLETRNSFRGKGAFQKGTGLSNVKTVAEKYGGAMKIETQENVFVLQVLLIIPQHPEDIPQQKD